MSSAAIFVWCVKVKDFQLKCFSEVERMWHPTYSRTAVLFADSAMFDIFTLKVNFHVSVMPLTMSTVLVFYACLRECIRSQKILRKMML